MAIVSSSTNLFNGSNPNSSMLSAINSRQQNSKLEAQSQQALSSGIDRYQTGDYEGAAKEFKRSIGISPRSQYSSQSSEYLASSYLKLGNLDKAVQVYKKAIELEPSRDQTYIKLGNLYFSMNKFSEAEQEYRDAVKINDNANNNFSLGQVFLRLEKFTEAENVFNKVKKLSPEGVSGNYGLAQTFRAQGRYDDAISHYQAAIKIKKDFYDAYSELGQVYSEIGKTDEADEIYNFLKNKSPELADTLSRYMYQAEAPGFAFITSDSTFSDDLGIGTPVSSLDAYLATANSSKQFTMIFQFNKEMDANSVESRFNWKISRSDKSGPGGLYNFGKAVSSTETSISPYPDKISYDKDLMRATVTFSINQNSTADATIDPAHILFKFSGEDQFGNKMNTDADEYSSFSRIA